jgi:DNA-binding NarL/FixJ family response regulator
MVNNLSNPNENAVPPSIFSAEEWQAICRSLKLSCRQCQIVSMVLQGQKAEYVAGILNISHDTVRAHLRRIYLKLHVRDRVGLLTCLVLEFRRLYTPLPGSPLG